LYLNSFPTHTARAAVTIKLFNKHTPTDPHVTTHDLTYLQRDEKAAMRARHDAAVVEMQSQIDATVTEMGAARE
jgi:hypothetical protein